MANRLYSPWRYPYLVSEKPDGCILCIKPEQDRERLVVYRNKHSFVILNLYPYNNGHVMVVPNRHIAGLQGLKPEESADLFAALSLSEKVIRRQYSPDGLNIGINIGKAAGAGVDEHLHIHIVPRWFGDSNFMTASADMRVIPEDFEQAYCNLKELFNKEEQS